MLDELKQEVRQEVRQAKAEIKSKNCDYLTGYICALSAVEDMIAEHEKTRKIVDAEKLIKKLNSRIDDFVKKHPEKKTGVEVESIRELIHIIELEAEE